MGTHASFVVVSTNPDLPAAYGYEHGDGRFMAGDLIDFATSRNGANAWECRGDDSELWAVTPEEFVRRWAQARTAVHLRCGRTGSGIETKFGVVADLSALGTEYRHRVLVDGNQVLEVRREHNARYGAGGTYTVTFDPAEVTHPTRQNTDQFMADFRAMAGLA